MEQSRTMEPKAKARCPKRYLVQTKEISSYFSDLTNMRLIGQGGVRGCEQKLVSGIVLTSGRHRLRKQEIEGNTAKARPSHFIGCWNVFQRQPLSKYP